MSNYRKNNTPWILVKAFWNFILILFIALTVFVSIKQNLYQNTWKELTQKEEVIEDGKTPETEIEVDLENETVEVKE